MNSKEKTAVNMLNRGIDIKVVAQKMRISETWLRLQQERVI